MGGYNGGGGGGWGGARSWRSERKGTGGVIQWVKGLNYL